MHHSSNFYVHLPSNNLSNSETNTLWNYVTHLTQPLLLDGAWEVALTEISYTKSWYNLTRDSFCSVFSLGYDISEAQNATTFYPNFDYDQQHTSTPQKIDETVRMNLHSQAVSNDISPTLKTEADIEYETETEPVSESFDGDDQLDDKTIAAKTGGTYLFRIIIKRGHYTLKELIETINNSLFYDTVVRSNGDWLSSPQLDLGKDGLITTVTGKMKHGDGKIDTFINITGDAADFLGIY